MKTKGITETVTYYPCQMCGHYVIAEHEDVVCLSCFFDN